MLIPGVPIQRDWKSRALETSADSPPFPHIDGQQVILGCAREALLVGLTLLDELPKTAHVPAYCCRSVLSPLQKLGVRIRFFDVGEQLEPILDLDVFEKGDLLLLVHFFGIPQDVERIGKLCSRVGMILVEDCAHALPDPESRSPMGMQGTFSIFSLRKLLPVPDGGVLVANNAKFQMRMKSIPHWILDCESTKQRITSMLDRFAFAVGWPNTLAIKDRLRSKLRSLDSEFYARIEGELSPSIAAPTFTFLHAVEWKRICRIRRQNYLWLAERVSRCAAGVTVPLKILPDGAVPQGLPIQVEKGAKYLRMAMRKKGICVDKWPGAELPDQVSPRDFPGSWHWHEKMLLLPTHQDLNIKHLDFCLKTLKESIP